MILRQLRKAGPTISSARRSSRASATRYQHILADSNTTLIATVNAFRHESSRSDASSRRPALHDAARRPRRRRHQGRAPRHRRRDARLGPAVRRRGSQRLLPEHQPKQARARRRLRVAADRSRLSSGCSRTPTSSSTTFGAACSSGAGSRRTNGARDGRSSIWCTITGFGAGQRSPGLRLRRPGRMRVDGDHRRAGRRSDEGRRRARRRPRGQGCRDRDSRARSCAGRERGRARAFTISLVDSARAALVNVAQNALVTGDDARRWGNAHPNLVPYQLFQRGGQTDRDRRGQRRAVGRVRARARTRSTRRRSRARDERGPASRSANASSRSSRGSSPRSPAAALAGAPRCGGCSERRRANGARGACATRTRRR